MGQGQSRNLFEAAASDELERAKYFIEHDQTDVNARDKVCIYFQIVPCRIVGQRYASLYM